MRILLDENLPRKLAGHLVGHECRTGVQCGWSGKTNGELLSLADSQFDVLLTLDKNLPYQQNLNAKRVAVLIIRARSNRIQDLLPIIPECLAALRSIQPRRCLAGSLHPRGLKLAQPEVCRVAEHDRATDRRGRAART